MNGSADATARQERGVRSVDDRFGGESGDVTQHKFDCSERHFTSPSADFLKCIIDVVHARRKRHTPVFVTPRLLMIAHQN
jgi:hypothetical protein